jgi:hypothetical protein
MSAANGGTVGGRLQHSTLATAADPANSAATSSPRRRTTPGDGGGGARRRGQPLDTANVPDKRVWFMNPRSYNYLYNVQNSLGVYVYRDELNKGTLLSYPVKKTTQIGTNYWDATGSNKDCRSCSWSR